MAHCGKKVGREDKDTSCQYGIIEKSVYDAEMMATRIFEGGTLSSSGGFLASISG